MRTNFSQGKVHAFTLIEVLIALAILAIALVGGVIALGRSARNVTHLKEVTLAHFVALNVVARCQSGLLKLPTRASPHMTGYERMMHEMFVWKASWISGIHQSQNKIYQRIRVDVTFHLRKTHVLARLTAFVRVHHD